MDETACYNWLYFGGGDGGMDRMGGKSWGSKFTGTDGANGSDVPAVFGGIGVARVSGEEDGESGTFIWSGTDSSNFGFVILFVPPFGVWDSSGFVFGSSTDV